VLLVDNCTCKKLLAADPAADVKIQTNGYVSQALYPAGRRGHTAVLYGNSMYIYGGYVDMKGSSGELWQFNFGKFVCKLFKCLSKVLRASDVADFMSDNGPCNVT